MIKFEFCKKKAVFARGVTVEEKLPERSSERSAGYDFFTPVTIIVPPGGNKAIMTNVKAKMDSDKVLLIVPRSSIGIKRSCVLANTIGVIDADYYNNEDNEGNIGIILHNYGMEPQQFNAGDKIAQGIFVQYFTADDKVTKKRKGGIGSTGK